MPPVTTFTKERIVQAACALLAEHGADALSARAVAARLGCSTAPIYSALGSLDELRAAVVHEARAQLRSYTRKDWTERPFLNQGTGLVVFAREQPQMFRLLFLDGGGARQTIPNVHRDLIEDMGRDARFKAFTAAQRGVVLEKLWYMSVGMATLAYSGQLKASSSLAISTALLEAGALLIPDAVGRIKKAPA